MQETWVQSLCWEDPLEKEMATHSSILSWKITWTEETVRHDSPWGCKSQTWLSDSTTTASDKAILALKFDSKNYKQSSKNFKLVEIVDLIVINAEY